MTDPRDRVLELALRRVLGPGPGAVEAPEAPDLAVRVREAWERETAARSAPGRVPGRRPRPGRPDARPGTRRRRRGWIPAGAVGALALLALGLWVRDRGAPAGPPPLAVAHADAWVLGVDAADEPVLRPRPAGPVSLGAGATDPAAADGAVLAAPAEGLDLTVAGRTVHLDGATLFRLDPPRATGERGDVAGPTLALLAGGLRVDAHGASDGSDTSSAAASAAPSHAPLALRLPGDARLTVPVGLGLAVRDARADIGSTTAPSTGPAPDAPPLSARVAAARATAPASPLGLWALELHGAGTLALDSGPDDPDGPRTLAASPDAESARWLATGDGPARVVDPALLAEFTGFLEAAREGDEKYASERFPPFGSAAEELLAAVRAEPALWQLRTERVAGLLEGTTLATLQRRHLLWWLVGDGEARAIEVARELWMRDPEAFDAQAIVALAERGVPEFQREVEAYFRYTDEDDALAALPFALYQVLRGDERRVPDLYPVLEWAGERPVDAGLAALALRRRGLAEPYAAWRAGMLARARDQVEQGGLERATYVARMIPWMDARAEQEAVPAIAHAMERVWFDGLELGPLITPEEVLAVLDGLER